MSYLHNVIIQISLKTVMISKVIHMSFNDTKRVKLYCTEQRTLRVHASSLKLRICNIFQTHLTKSNSSRFQVYFKFFFKVKWYMKGKDDHTNCCFCKKSQSVLKRIIKKIYWNVIVRQIFFTLWNFLSISIFFSKDLIFFSFLRQTL